MSMPIRNALAGAAFTVSDLDGALNALNGKGIEASNKSVSKSVKTAIISDPDGNQVVLAEALTDEIAR